MFKVKNILDDRMEPARVILRQLIIANFRKKSNDMRGEHFGLYNRSLLPRICYHYMCPALDDAIFSALSTDVDPVGEIGTLSYLFEGLCAVLSEADITFEDLKPCLQDLEIDASIGGTSDDNTSTVDPVGQSFRPGLDSNALKSRTTLFSTTARQNTAQRPSLSLENSVDNTSHVNSSEDNRSGVDPDTYSSRAAKITAAHPVIFSGVARLRRKPARDLSPYLKNLVNDTSDTDTSEDGSSEDNTSTVDPVKHSLRAAVILDPGTIIYSGAATKECLNDAQSECDLEDSELSGNEKIELQRRASI